MAQFLVMSAMVMVLNLVPFVVEQDIFHGMVNLVTTVAALVKSTVPLVRAQAKRNAEHAMARVAFKIACLKTEISAFNSLGSVFPPVVVTPS